MKREKKISRNYGHKCSSLFLRLTVFFWEKGVSEGAVLTLSFLPPFFPVSKAEEEEEDALQIGNDCPFSNIGQLKRCFFGEASHFGPSPFFPTRRKKLKKRTKNLSSCVYIRNPRSSSFYAP